MKFNVILQNERGETVSTTVPRPYKQINETIKTLSSNSNDKIIIKEINLNNYIKFFNYTDDINSLNHLAYILSRGLGEEAFIAIYEAYTKDIKTICKYKLEAMIYFEPNKNLKEYALFLSKVSPYYKNLLNEQGVADINRVINKLIQDDYHETSTGLIAVYHQSLHNFPVF